MNPIKTPLTPSGPLNDLQSLILKYWITKTISYCPDSRLKGQKIFNCFLTSVERARQNQNYLEFRLPSRPVFYSHIREAVAKGLIGSDYVRKNKELLIDMNCRKVRIIRRNDGLYFEDLFLDVKRLYLPSLPNLIDNSYRENLLNQAQQTGIEKFFCNSVNFKTNFDEKNNNNNQ